jgi:hypothetical protein
MSTQLNYTTSEASVRAPHGSSRQPNGRKILCVCSARFLATAGSVDVSSNAKSDDCVMFSVLLLLFMVLGWNHLACCQKM